MGGGEKLTLRKRSSPLQQTIFEGGFHFKNRSIDGQVAVTMYGALMIKVEDLPAAKYQGTSQVLHLLQST